MILSTTKKAAIVAAAAIIFSAGIIVWQVQARRPRALYISPDDMTLIVQDQPATLRAQLAGDSEARKDFAKNLQQLLSIAEEARAAGIADRPNIRRQLDLMRALLIAEAYQVSQRSNAGAQPELSNIPPEEIEKFLNAPGQEKKFEDFLNDARGLGFPIPGELEEADRQRLRQDWARIFLLARKGMETGIDRNRKTELQLLFQEARILVQHYAEAHLSERVKPAEAEVDAALAKARGKAEEALRRVKAGEEFASLARQYSEDTRSKDRGGDMGWIRHGDMPQPFEDALFALKPGEVSGLVETFSGYHIIKAGERRMSAPEEGAEPEEEIAASQILISVGSSQPMMPFGQPSIREQVRASLQQEKQKRVLEEITQRSRVVVAEDFTVPAPSVEELQQGFPQMDDDHDDEVPEEDDAKDSATKNSGNSNTADTPKAQPRKK